jgi:hypothetical protein
MIGRLALKVDGGGEGAGEVFGRALRRGEAQALLFDSRLEVFDCDGGPARHLCHFGLG